MPVTHHQEKNILEGYKRKIEELKTQLSNQLDYVQVREKAISCERQDKERIEDYK